MSPTFPSRRRTEADDKAAVEVARGKSRLDSKNSVTSGSETQIGCLINYFGFHTEKDPSGQFSVENSGGKSKNCTFSEYGMTDDSICEPFKGHPPFIDEFCVGLIGCVVNIGWAAAVGTVAIPSMKNLFRS